MVQAIIKRNLKSSKVNTNTWEAETTKQTRMRACVARLTQSLRRVALLQPRGRAARKSRVPLPNAVPACSKCNKM